METKININKMNRRKDSGFKVPESYFEDLETQILSKTIQKIEQVPQLPVSIWMKSSYAVISAAVILIAFMLMKPDAAMDIEGFAYQPSIDLYSDYDEMWIAQEVNLSGDDQGDMGAKGESEINEQIDSLLDDGVTNTEILDIYINNN